MATGPINAKSFIEFFEKQYGVQFIDTATGKKTRDLIVEKERQSLQEHVCGACRFGHRDDGKYLFKEDIVCNNSHSPQVTESVSLDSDYDHWTPVDNKAQKNGDSPK